MKSQGIPARPVRIRVGRLTGEGAAFIPLHRCNAQIGGMISVVGLYRDHAIDMLRAIPSGQLGDQIDDLVRGGCGALRLGAVLEQGQPG